MDVGLPSTVEIGRFAEALDELATCEAESAAIGADLHHIVNVGGIFDAGHPMLDFHDQSSTEQRKKFRTF